MASIFGCNFCGFSDAETIVWSKKPGLSKKVNHSESENESSIETQRKLLTMIIDF